MLGWNETIKSKLGACGQNVFIGHNVMFARPEQVFLDDNVRIDPFTLINCGLIAGPNIQITSHVVMNGRKTVTMKGWNFVGYNTTILTGSEDFTGDHGPVNDFFGKNPSIEECVVFEKYSGVLSNCTVMPGVILPEGAVIAAQSYTSKGARLEPYAIHMMQRPLEGGERILLPRWKRNKENINRFAEEWKNAEQE